MVIMVAVVEEAATMAAMVEEVQETIVETTDPIVATTINLTLMPFVPFMVTILSVNVE